MAHGNGLFHGPSAYKLQGYYTLHLLFFNSSSKFTCSTRNLELFACCCVSFAFGTSRERNFRGRQGGKRMDTLGSRELPPVGTENCSKFLKSSGHNCPELQAAEAKEEERDWKLYTLSCHFQCPLSYQ